MTREFVILSKFDRQEYKMGLSGNELHQKQETLLESPKAGDRIWGIKEMRKMKMI